MRRHIRTIAWIAGLTTWMVIPVSADMLSLRDGTNRSGTILNADNDSYVFSDLRGTQSIAKDLVRFAVYSDPEKAAEQLGLADLHKHVSSTKPAEVRVLTAEDFSQEVIEAVRNAKRSVRVMTYYLSEGDSSESREFYQLLREKAKAKKKVTIIAPFGSRAHAAAKISSMNTGQKLENEGIKVRYLQRSKVQHKKLIIVDGKTVFLGSSNLTSAGMSKNQEINVKITDPTFVAEATKDFTSMLRKAKTRNALKM